MALDLTMGVGSYDRVRPIETGEVPVEGVDLTFVHRGPGELFDQVAKHQPYDVAEMSLSTYTLWTAEGDCPYVGIPAFPSRYFRHSSIYVREGSGIEEPADLEGGKVGVFPQYQVTLALMVRGMLRHEYGLGPEDVEWYAAEPEKRPVDLPDGVEKHVIPRGDTLDRMLEDGEIDALVTVLFPEKLGDGVRRLFPDFKEVEMDYYRRTGIFPLMHTVLLHEDVYGENPWVATELYESLVEAKDLAMDRLYNPKAVPVTLPWLVDHVEETREALGEDYWPYGFEANRTALEAITDYSHEQGLSSRRVEPEELFVEELRGGFEPRDQSVGSR